MVHKRKGPQCLLGPPVKMGPSSTGYVYLCVSGGLLAFLPLPKIEARDR